MCMLIVTRNDPLTQLCVITTSNDVSRHIAGILYKNLRHFLARLFFNRIKFPLTADDIIQLLKKRLLYRISLDYYWRRFTSDLEKGETVDTELMF
jgi:hypothetical protein